jgi:hypothetical protein
VPPGVPRWGDVAQFCLVEGYRETNTDHRRFVKVLRDGTTSGTMISNGVLPKGTAGDVIEPLMWRKVWQKQLRLASEAEFWTGLAGGKVQYDVPPSAEPQQPLPSYLERFLRQMLRWSDAQIAATTRDEAQELLNAHWAGQLGSP